MLRVGGLLGPCSWLSVAVSPSGSYGTAEILAYLEAHLEDWREGRDWRLRLCDAYAPHAQDAVRALCWAKGYILLLHGGGTTGVAQPPDTHLHAELSREFQEAEMRDLAARMNVEPSTLPLRSRADCVRDLVALWKSPELHRRAARGFAQNMLTNKVDGSEDHLGSGDAAALWQSLGMAALRSQLVSDVTAEVAAGRLPWSFASVRRLIEDFPRRGQLDFYVEGQEDEGEGVDEDRGAAWDAGAELSPDLSDEDGGEGDADAADGGALPALAGDCGAAAQPLLDRLSALDRLREAAREVEDPRISKVIDAVRRRAAKAAMGTGQEDDRVARLVRREAERREAELASTREEARRRKEEKEGLRRERARLDAIADAQREQQERLRKAAAKERHASLCDAASRGFTAEMFGQGQARGGGRREKAARQDAFRRVLALAGGLPPDLANDVERQWPAWDAYQAERYKEAWGSQYRDALQRLLLLAQGGRESEVHAWWRWEVRRRGAPAELVVPGAEARVGGSSSASASMMP